MYTVHQVGVDTDGYLGEVVSGRRKVRQVHLAAQRVLPPPQPRVAPQRDAPLTSNGSEHGRVGARASERNLVGRAEYLGLVLKNLRA